MLLRVEVSARHRAVVEHGVDEQLERGPHTSLRSWATRPASREVSAGAHAPNGDSLRVELEP
ncbi:hypothetical protein EMGBD1_15330, partial [Anaerolineaceae bacterium]